ncbi:unnamed protein product [Aphanomyces euteiches]|uniref:BAG domain-containing protein n=1 Tax=Aphanomyces euteiches TaxID=100861 RepID=A0A6G0XM73_9STRA|nr:hypothetical protein Ae201684_003440 [Aphanomyces euteiches]KAH9098669.1 hypothetical protein Ae201684P_017880 [Aphanomyces euteiches]
MTRNIKAIEQLSSIHEELRRIQDVLESRLPTQYKLVASEIAAAKWLSLIDNDKAKSREKACSLRVKNYRYRVLEQAERLTRLLCELDVIESDGDEEIRKQRKQTVLSVQGKLDIADTMKLQCDRLLDFHQRMLLLVPSRPTSSIQTQSSPAADTTDDDNEDMEEEDDNASDASEATSKEEDEEMDHMSKLPMWKPKWEMYESADDSIHLVANLAGVNLDRHLDIRVHGDTLRLSGIKLPSKKDLHIQQWFVPREPSFGRFTIEETFPRRYFNLSNATVRVLPNGHVDIRVPRRRVRQRVTPYMRSQWPAALTDFGLAWERVWESCIM